ncbi:MAG: ATP-dependent RNA helicase HrpA, partial [Burkholderiales bacterium]
MSIDIMAYSKLHIAFFAPLSLTLCTTTNWLALVADLNATLFADRVRLGQRLNRARGQNDLAAVEKLVQQIRLSKAKAAHRQERLPRPSFSDALPIANRREEIQAAIAANQVVIVCGETGSGKTTQLPKICLELKRGIYGTIGCTQPRRIAARSVAARIAQELQTEVGQLVGYKVRFTDRVQDDTLIKVMTDGILLAEIHSDRWLSQYDTLIIDEAHERSVNIDFLLGYLKQLLPKRPELKVIITSATIDAERFATHFDGAPIIEVSGRMYPVDVHYRPMGEDDDDEEINLNTAIIRAVDELLATPGAGDALVFLPGEREIRYAAEALRKHAIANTEILALFARLSVPEQDRVFNPGAARRIILATNVAETSLTVPRIRYVIDSGLARLNRFSQRSKINQLQVEKISRAAAKQRAGRCGRVASGVCLRLYSEADHDARPEYTTPEILRTSLAAVILRMQALGLGDVTTFPFLEAPSPRSIEAGYQLLAELGAVNEQRVLTGLGRDLAKLPVDPKIGRMLLAAKAENCLTEMLVLTAALSVQDPRERPQDKRETALEKHRLFCEERSDFLSYLKMWQFFEDAIKHKKSNRKLAQLCYEHFLSFIRLREWREVHQQLHTVVAEMGMRLNEAPATYDQIHRALLTGLLGHIGFKDPDADSYLGARDTKFFLPQDSVLAKKKSKWVMAAELTETTKLYGRCAAEILPEWIEQAGKSLLARTHHDPHWEKKSGQVIAFERATLYGLPVITKRRVHFGPIDPQQSRELFIRGALVARDYESRAPFFEHNTRLIKEIEALEHKSRRQNVLVDDQTLFAFYDPLIPEGIYNAAAFEQWRKDAERANPKLLFLSRDYLMRHGAHGVTEELYPAHLSINGQDYPLRYRFDPGHPLDGVTLTLPLAMLNQLDVTRCDWLAPGMLRDKVTTLMRGLPQRIRRVFVPLAESVTRALEALDRVDPEKKSLILALAAHIEKNHRLVIANDDWSTPPEHLRMNYRVIDLAGEELAVGRDIEALRQQLGQAATASLRSQGAQRFERDGIRTWDFGDLPSDIEIN